MLVPSFVKIDPVVLKKVIEKCKKKKVTEKQKDRLTGECGLNVTISNELKKNWIFIRQSYQKGFFFILTVNNCKKDENTSDYFSYLLQG